LYLKNLHKEVFWFKPIIKDMTYFYFWIALFSIITYIFVIDENVIEYIILWINILKINLERLKWMIILHPNNFIYTWMIKRRADVTARKLAHEFDKKAKSEV